MANVSYGSVKGSAVTRVDSVDICTHSQQNESRLDVTVRHSKHERSAESSNRKLTMNFRETDCWEVNGDIPLLSVDAVDGVSFVRTLNQRSHSLTMSVRSCKNTASRCRIACSVLGFALCTCEVDGRALLNVIEHDNVCTLTYETVHCRRVTFRCSQMQWRST